MRSLVSGVVALAVLAGVGLVGCSRGPAPVETAPRDPPPVAAAGYFEDVTAGSGVDFAYRNGDDAGLAAILESLGGGVALLDYDGDGLLDIFVTGGGSFGGPDKRQIKGRPCKLYKNLGGFKFRDVTAEAGLDKLAGGAEWFYSHGC